MSAYQEKLKQAKEWLAQNPPANPVVVGRFCEQWPRVEAYELKRVCPTCGVGHYGPWANCTRCRMQEQQEAGR